MADTGERRRVLRKYVEEQPSPPAQQADTGRMLALPDGRLAFIPNPALRHEEQMADCGSEHGKVVTRLAGHDTQLADHETRIRTGERRGADVAGKLLWVFVTAVVCGAVSLVVTLLTAAEGG